MDGKYVGTKNFTDKNTNLNVDSNKWTFMDFTQKN